jgi:hypothetical protein
MAIVGMDLVGYNGTLLNYKCYFVKYLLSFKEHQKFSDLISLLGRILLLLVAQVYEWVVISP